MSFGAWPMTPAVKWFLIVNGGVWLVLVISVNWMDALALHDHLALTPDRVYPGLELWQLFTYMWLHSTADFSHILFNSLFLWMFGGALEQAWGTRAFTKFYLICGIGAGLVVFLVGSMFHSDLATVGASGVIYGLVVAWAIVFPDRIIYFFGLFPIKGKYFALFPIGYALIDFLMRGSGVSHSAHLGGLAIGALLVTGYWRPSRLYNRVRYAWLRRKLKVVEGGNKKRKPPPGGGYWH
jgi:membrane associated rhomboid family serine protease